MTREARVVLLVFGPAHRQAALDALRALVERLLPQARLRGVVVDNALDGNFERELDDAFTLVSGDNACHEFSGWDRGLAWLEAAHGVPANSVLVLGNDTLHRSYGSGYLAGFTRTRLQETLRARGLLGWIDAYPREVELFGQRMQRWIRTSLFAAEAGVLAELRPFAARFADEQVFAGGGGELFRAPSPLSENYRCYLRTWLFGERCDPEFSEVWHSAAPLSPHNAAAFRAKLRCILCEHQLAARARARNLPLIDVR